MKRRRRRKGGLEKKIEELRQAPLSHRRKVAFLVSMTATCIVASMWVTVIFPRTVLHSEGELQATGSSPLEQIMNDSRLIFEDVERGVSELRELSGGAFFQNDAEADESERAPEEEGDMPPPRNDTSQSSNEQSSDASRDEAVPLEPQEDDPESTQGESADLDDEGVPDNTQTQNGETEGSNEGDSATQTGENAL